MCDTLCSAVKISPFLSTHHSSEVQAQVWEQLMARVLLQDYTEDYIQTGPGQLHAHSTRLFTADGVSVPYTWNHSITYDSSRGRMPFLVQTLRAASITTDYNPLEEAVAFKIQASIAKGIVLGLPRNPAMGKEYLLFLEFIESPKVSKGNSAKLG